MNRKLTALLLIMTMLCAWGLSAFAAPGDTTQFTKSWIDENIGGDNQNLRDGLLIGNTFYLLLPASIYTYTLGEEEPKFLSSFLPGKEKEYLFYSTFLEAQEALGDDANHLLGQLFLWGDQLYGLNILTGEAFLVNQTTGEIDFQTPLKLDFDIPEIKELGEGIGIKVTVQETLDNSLFILINVYGQVGEKTFLYAFDLTTGERKAYQQNSAVNTIQRLFPYQNGKLLAVLDVDPYQENSDSPQQIMIFDPKTDAMTLFMQLPQGNYSGFAYGLNENALYYNAKGKIYRQEEKGDSLHVGYIGGSGFYSSDKAFVTDEKHYIIYNDESGMIIKNADPQYMSGKTLVLDIDSYTTPAVNEAFRQKYPDMPLIFNGESGGGYHSAQDIAVAIQTGDSGVDIFSVGGGSIKTLIEKDYAGLIESETIFQNINRMYPYIKETLVKTGGVYAVPYRIYMDPTNSYSPQYFKEVGLSEEDLPKTYIEYLEFIKRWYNELAAQNPEYGLFSSPPSKDGMIYDIVSAYGNVYKKKGEPVDYDTPLFRALMTKVNEVFENLNLDSVEEYTDRPLFESYGDNILGGATQSYKPFLLSLDEGVEVAIKVDVSYLFINPLSQNKEVATAYFEEVLNHYTAQEKILYYVDENKPIINEYYEEWINGWEENVTQAKAQLETETLEGSERKAVEDTIWRGEGFIENKDKYYWEVSAEDIAYFESIADAFFISAEGLTDMENESNNIYKIMEEYTSGSISLDEFIKEANRREQMAAMEDN